MAFACTDFGSALSTFMVLWIQHLCSRVVGKPLFRDADSEVAADYSPYPLLWPYLNPSTLKM